jgi:OmpA-OmpF porin, OOP family
MFHKKYLLLFTAFCLIFAGASFAQESQQPAAKPASSPQWSNRDMTYRGKNYDVMDSSYYSKGKRSKQFHKYMDHQEIFPPKPRNKWEIGAGFGLYNVIGNVPTLMLWQKGGGGVNVNVRKSLGYIFSMRTQFIYGVGKNLDRQPTSSYDGPYTKFGYTPLYYAQTTGTFANPIYRATRTEAVQLNLDLMFNAYNINFHQARNAVSFFGFFGLGALGYKTRINALDGKFQPYNFGAIVKDPGEKNNKVRKDLQKGMDKTFESAADNPGANHILDHKILDFAPSIGAGVQYKLNKTWNIQVEDRYTFPADRFLDGSPFGLPLGNTVATGRANDAINYFSLGLNYNLNTKKKSVEPLYWINPLDHAYSELSYPRHMILPNPVLPDEDGDGITDQFDKCPKTPAGVAVDSHGCPLDTDGDGVPDYKDKQLITPTECQPVDADGVGHCPCPDACKDMNGGNSSKNGPCGNIGVGTLLFTTANRINTGMEAQLAVLASQMQANPTCKVVILGGGSGSKAKEQHSWEHVNAVIDYMSEKNNISRDRFIFKYGEAGDENIVTYRPANMDESGASNVPPPHPEIK